MGRKRETEIQREIGRERKDKDGPVSSEEHWVKIVGGGKACLLKGHFAPPYICSKIEAIGHWTAKVLFGFILPVVRGSV